ncbi:MAG: transglutaminase domain-containing protein [Acidobacteria bacterium]|nr:transglutaminase domain-containing protein [Acidobacteriota bacterium]
MTFRIVVGIAILLSVVAAVALVSRPPEPALAVRHFEFTYEVRLPELPASGHAVRLWLPFPQSDEHQQISVLSIESPVPFEEHSEREYGNKYLYVQAQQADLRESLAVRMRFRVTRQEHQVALNQGGGTVLATTKPPQALARFLQPDRLVPLDDLIVALSRQETQGRRTPLEKARAVYDYVISTLRYDKSGEGWGRGDALFACRARRGNCTDFHALLIGMMRAAGIPARFEIGFPLPPAKAEGEIPGYHCWAQFYVEPYGWIPVDASEAWKQPEKRDYFFGAHDEHRVLFTLGRDVRLNPTPAGEPLNYFIYPYAEVDGKPFEQVETRFTFRDLPTPAPPARQ